MFSFYLGDAADIFAMRLAYYMMVCAAFGLLVTNATFAKQTLPDPLRAGWQGMPVCERLFENDSQRILRCSFLPGAGHERHFHIAHFGYAISGGKMRLTDNQGVREVELKTGTSFSSDGTPWHEVLNIGKTTVIYLIIEDKVP